MKYIHVFQQKIFCEFVSLLISDHHFQICSTTTNFICRISEFFCKKENFRKQQKIQKTKKSCFSQIFRGSFFFHCAPFSLRINVADHCFASTKSKCTIVKGRGRHFKIFRKIEKIFFSKMFSLLRLKVLLKKLVKNLQVQTLVFQFLEELMVVQYQ